MSWDLIVKREKHLGVITLNRPKALNALTMGMIEGIYNQLQAWKHDPEIHAVVICSVVANIFCAGGDVRWLYDSGRNKDPKQLEFFNKEYKLNQLIHDYPKPYIALMDGVTMGGGVGISLHGSHPVASENFSFAMPETTIGFFPDIGSSYLLARCPDNFGIYLGLVGDRVNAVDAKKLGLVKYCISAKEFPEIIANLAKLDLTINAADKVDSCLSKFNHVELKSEILDLKKYVNETFAKNSVEEIFDALKNGDTDWHKTTLQKLAKKSPLSLKVTLEQLRKVGSGSLQDALNMDTCLVSHF